MSEAYAISMMPLNLSLAGQPLEEGSGVMPLVLAVLYSAVQSDRYTSSIDYVILIKHSFQTAIMSALTPSTSSAHYIALVLRIVDVYTCLQANCISKWT